MKKLLNSAFAVTILFGGLFAVSSASASNNDCKEVEFNNETVCVSIEDAGSDRYSLLAENIDGTAGSLRCDIMLPDSTLKTIPSCDGKFSYTKGNEGRIKLWIRSNDNAPIDWEDKPSDTSTWTYPQWMYDFDNAEWADSNNESNSDSNGDLDNFYLTTDDTTPSTNTRVDLTVKARDGDNSTVTDYTDTINFKVYKRASGSSSWTLTTSSSDFEIKSTYEDGYDFTSSNHGQKTLTDFIKFKRNNYSYKVRVYDENDTSIYKEITYTIGSVNNDNNNGDLDNFSLSTDDTTPSTNTRVDLSIEARDSDNEPVTTYNDTVNFKVYKRASGSSSWTLTTSSSDFEIDSDYDNGYDFSSSDDGDKTLTNFIRFKRNNYSYKVRVYDESNTSIYKEITYTVGSVNNNDGNYSTDNFYLSTDDTTPSTTQWVDLTVKARDGTSTDTEYTNDIVVRVYYRTNTSSWTETTSSTYFTINSTYDSDYQDGIRFSSSWAGVHTFSDFIKFKKDYQYKVVVEDVDDSDIYGEKTFDAVGSNTSNGDLDNFYLTTSDTTPSTNTRVDLSIEARDSDNDPVTTYTDTVNFKVYKRASGSSSWTLTTSSSDFEIDSDYDNGYDFSSSDDGDKTLTNFIRFKRNNYSYKVRVYDESNTSIYKEITYTVGSVSNVDAGDIDNFYVSTDDTSPARSQWVDLIIQARDSSYDTITNYTNTVKFKVQKKSGSSWVTASTSYYSLSKTYYTFVSSNYGEKTLTDLIKFSQDGEYKVIVYDEDSTSADGERIFDVNYNGGSNSSVDGFTSDELVTVQSMYDAWPNMITDLKAQYSKLRNSTTWKTRSDTFYDDTNDILDDVSSKKYDTYDTWYSAFLSRYRYTLSIK